MKQLIHWGLIASLVGGVAIAPPLLVQRPAIALSEDEVLKRLERVPLFVVATPERGLVSEPVPNPKDQKKILKLTRFFPRARGCSSLSRSIQSCASQDQPETAC